MDVAIGRDPVSRELDGGLCGRVVGTSGKGNENRKQESEGRQFFDSHIVEKEKRRRKEIFIFPAPLT
jgi:hypothetical protein